MSSTEWGVYLLKCSDDSLYCGITNNMDSRLETHNQGKGAKYTRGRRPVKLLCFSGNLFSHSEALKHERAVKKLPRARKEAYISKMSNAKQDSK